MSFAATTGRDDRRPSPPNILRGDVGGVNSSRSPSAGANNNNTSRSQSVQQQHQHVAFQSPLPAIPTLAIPQNLGRLLRQQQNGRDGSASQAPLSSRRSPASTYRRNQSPQATFRSNGGDITARSVRHGSPPSAAVASGGFIPAFAQDVLHLSSATPLLPQHMLRYVQFHSGKSRDDIPELESFFTHGRSVVHTMPNVFVRCMTLVNGEMWIGERGGAISRWGAHDAELIQRAERSNRSLLVCCMMPVGLHVWCGMSDGTLKILHPSDATRIIKEIKEHAGAITCMELSFNEHYVFTGSSDFIVTQWSATEGSRVQAFSGHHAAVRCLRVVGIRLFSGADDGHIIEWDVARGKSLHILNGHKSAVRCLQASTMYLWSGGEDATVRVWLLESDMNTPSWVTDAPAIAAGENEATLEGLQRVMSQQRTSTMKAIREAKYKRAGVVLLPQTDGADGAENGDEVGGRPSYAQEQDRATALAGVLDARLPPPVCQHIITSPFTASVTHLQAVGNKMWSVSLGTVYVWNNRTFALEAQFREHEGMLSATHTVRQSVLSRVWTAGTEGNVLLWNVECNYQSALESSSDLHTAHLEHSLEQHFLREEKLAADALIHRTANERLSTEIDSLQQELRALHNAKRLSEVNLQSQIHELEDTVRARDATIEALRAESLALSERLGVPVSGREMRLKLLAEQACRGSVLVAETDPLASKMEASMDALAMLSKELETLHQERLISAQAKLAAAREKKEQQLILESQERERQQQQLLAALSPSSSSGLRRKGSSSRSHSRMRSSDSMMSSRSSSHHLLPEDNEDDATTTTADDTPSKLSKKRRSHSSGGRREEGAAPGHVRMRSSDSIVSVGLAGHAGLPVKDAALPTTVDSSISREQHIDAAPEDATAVVEECDPRTSKVVTPPPSAIALVSTNDAEAAHNGTDTMVALGSPLSQSQKRTPAADTKPTAGPTSQPTIPAAAPLLVEPTSFAGNDFAIADCNRLRQDLHHVYAWCASLQRAVADLHGACALVLSSADTTEENVVNTSVPSVPPKKVEFSTSAALTDGAVLVMRSRPVDDHDESEGTSERGGTTPEADLDLDALGWLSIRELSPEDRAEVVRLLDCGVCKLVLSQKPTTTTTSSSTLPQEVSSYNCASASTTTLPSLVVFPHWSELSSHNDNNTSWFLSLVPRYRRQHHSDATGAASPSELLDSRTFAQQSLPTAVASRHELALSGAWRPTAFSRGKPHTSSTVSQLPKAETEPVSLSATTGSCDEEAPTTDHHLSERDSSIGGVKTLKQRSSSAIDARVGVVGYQSVLSDISGTLVDVDRTVSMLASQLLSKDNSLMHQLRIRENALRLSSTLLKQCGGVNALATESEGIAVTSSNKQQDSSSSPQRLLLDEEIQTYLDDLKLHTCWHCAHRKVIVESMNTLRDAKNQMKEFEADLLAGAFVVDDPSKHRSTTNENTHEDIASLGDVVALEVKEAVQQHDSLSMTTIASLRRSGVEFTCVAELQEQFFALLQERSQYACDLENAMKGFDCLTTQLAHDVLLHDHATNFAAEVAAGDNTERSVDRADCDDDADASSRTRDSMVASEGSDDSDSEDRSSSLISGESSSSSYADNSALQAARRAQHEAAEAEQKQKRKEILDSQSHPLVIRARDSLFPDVSRVLATARRTHDEHQAADEAAQAAVHEISETLPTVKHNLPSSETDLLLPAETHSSITTTSCLEGGNGDVTSVFNQRMNDMRSLVTHLCSVTTALSRRCDKLSHAWQRDLGEYLGQQQIIEAICDDAIQQVASPE
ncbi:WD40 repeat-containing protein, putative, partial [Bodo saltans]